MSEDRALVPVKSGDPELDAAIEALLQNPAAVNPLHAAAVAERAQFDGDVPEARGKPLPPGVAPAVPVSTDARSPVAIGVALKDASDRVAARAGELRQEFVAALEVAAADAGAGSIVVADAARDALTVMAEHGEADPEGYERGKEAQALAVPDRDGASLLALSKDEASAAAWAVVSTTQGRRSASSPVSMIVGRRLGLSAAAVAASEFADRTGELCRSSWTAGLVGRGEVQPRFAIVDVAGAALANALRAKLAEHGVDASDPGLRVEVATLDAVAHRQVGWAARVVREGRP